MIIETKYDIGQTVWMMECNCPEEYEVTGIECSVGSGEFYIPRYNIKSKSNPNINHERVIECGLYATKRELCLSFLNDDY